MTPEYEFLLGWIEICLIIASLATTLFPVVYAFSPWWKSYTGRALMATMVSFSLAMDFTVYNHFWPITDLYISFWVSAIIFGLIAVTTLSLTTTLIYMNYFNKELEHERER